MPDVHRQQKSQLILSAKHPYRDSPEKSDKKLEDESSGLREYVFLNIHL